MKTNVIFFCKKILHFVTSPCMIKKRVNISHTEYDDIYMYNIQCIIQCVLLIHYVYYTYTLYIWC